MRWILVALVACHSTPPVPPKPAAPELEQVDVFGSHQLDRATAIAKWGDQLLAIMHTWDAQGDLAPLEDKLKAEIQATGKYALVEVSIIGYFKPKKTYVTIDLVDAADRDRRMTFLPAPTGELPDPDGLLAMWQEYEQKVMGMLMAGQLPMKHGSCAPAWHCISFDHESLVPYRDAFMQRVPAVEADLVRVLREDKRDANRGAAAYLLAHLASGDRVVELMLPAMRDPSSLVRNDAMRVLALIAQDHPEIAIPLDPVLDALAFPTTTDRNKASAILSGITKHAQLTTAQRAAIRTRAGTTLVDMLALRQPNNHDYAYEILKNVSGKDLGEHAIDAWRGWLNG
jgi:hypothetical protein